MTGLPDSLSSKLPSPTGFFVCVCNFGATILGRNLDGERPGRGPWKFLTNQGATGPIPVGDFATGLQPC
jgi:hypothetical protein